MDLIPSFIYSRRKVLRLANINIFKLTKIRKVLSHYNDIKISTNYDRYNHILLIKKGKKIKRNTKPISKIKFNCHVPFVTKKVFDPIIIECDKKKILEHNLKVIINGFLNKKIDLFGENETISSLKAILPALNKKEDCIINKDYLNSLFYYVRCLNIRNLFSSECLRYKNLIGNTDFRLGDTIYQIKNKKKITKKDISILCVFAFIYKKLFNIQIKKVVILSPIKGEEYSLQLIPEFINFNFL